MAEDETKHVVVGLVPFGVISLRSFRNYLEIEYQQAMRARGMEPWTMLRELG